MGNRPINRRPWRRKPWRKNARPKRWISLNSGTTAFADQGILNGPLWDVPAALSGSGTQPAVVLASGQVDVEPWADNQEITVDRIVGQITLQGSALQTYAVAPASNAAPSTYVRLGMIVQEETDATSAPFIDLWSDENLEDYEWMWLREVVPTNWNYQRVSVEATSGAWGFSEEIMFDSGLRRKIGPTDNLLLYAQYAIVQDVNVDTLQAVVHGSHLLRSIFLSK